MQKQQIVLVTGATTGIGRETALHLARLGHRVFATGRKAAVLAELQAEAGDLPLETFTLDVNDDASIQAARAEVDRRTEGYGLDVLVNNAGYANMAPMELISEAHLRAMFETNVVGLVKLTQQFVPAMRKRRAGKIINVGSVVGKVTFPLQGIYCATKHAVEAISDSFRLELRPFGVHVSIVQPGTIKTQFGDTATSTVSAYKELDSPYQGAIAHYDRLLEKTYKTAPGPLCVARTIARVIRRRRPAARYVSPRIVKAMIWLNGWMPTRLMDWLLRKIFGLTPKALNAPR